MRKDYSRLFKEKGRRILFPDLNRTFPLHFDMDGKPYPPGKRGLMKWAKDFESEKRRIAFDKLPYQRVLSTVWMGIDLSYGLTKKPLIFESMVLTKQRDGLAQARYATKQADLRGHARLLKEWRRKG